MKKTTYAAGLVFLLACAPPQMEPEQRRHACGPEPTIEQAISSVAFWVQNGGLKDPFSAQTRTINVLGRGAMQNGILRGGEWHYGWVISFEVNAKNSFGAYVGWQRRSILWNRGDTSWLISPLGDGGDVSPILFR